MELPFMQQKWSIVWAFGNQVVHASAGINSWIIGPLANNK